MDLCESEASLFYKVSSKGEIARCGGPGTKEAEAGRSLLLESQPGLHSKLQASQSYTVRHCLKNKQTKNR